MIDKQTISAREKLVLDHFHDEVDDLWDDVLSTFPHPHYEIIPTLTIHDSDSDVRKYYKDSRIAFPDQDHEIISLRHSHDAVITEFWLMGTHLGPLGGMPAAGGRFRVRITAFFICDEDENLVCERIYFDSLTIFKQLMGNLNMRNPKN
ncbi:MAG: putative ester cyclase [Cryomorphaceae bacterium]|jgi:predicted ester cyclase